MLSEEEEEECYSGWQENQSILDPLTRNVFMTSCIREDKFILMTVIPLSDRSATTPPPRSQLHRIEPTSLLLMLMLLLM